MSIPSPAPRFSPETQPIPGLVSVVIPTYNRARFIVQAVESVLDQTYRNFEVIVVDDGSTDHTEALIRERFGQNKRVRYIRQKNSERCEARNNGIRNSRGEFIAFLDSDDLWRPDKLEKQMECFSRHPDTDLVFSDFSYIDDEGRPVAGPVHPNYDEVEMRGYFNTLVGRNLIGAHTPLIRRSIFEKSGLFSLDWEIMMGEDWEMWARIAYHGRIRFLPQIAALCRKHPSNTMVPVTASVYATIVRKILRATDPGDHPKIRRLASGSYIDLVELDLKREGWQPAFKAMIAGIRLLGRPLIREAFAPSKHWLMASLIMGPKLYMKIWQARSRARGNAPHA
jgi:glycosyltransferase involved in cell wall biosynthesis